MTYLSIPSPKDWNLNFEEKQAWQPQFSGGIGTCMQTAQWRQTASKSIAVRSIAICIATWFSLCSAAPVKIDMEGSLVEGGPLPNVALVPLMRAYPQELTQCLGKKPSRLKEIVEFFSAVPVDLNADGVRDYLVRGGCGVFWGAHSNRFWVLIGKKGNKGLTYSIGTATSGMVLEVMPERTQGFQDLLLESQLSSDTGGQIHYKWKCDMYQPYRCRTWNHSVDRNPPRWGSCESDRVPLAKRNVPLLPGNRAGDGTNPCEDGGITNQE